MILFAYLILWKLILCENNFFRELVGLPKFTKRQQYLNEHQSVAKTNRLQQHSRKNSHASKHLKHSKAASTSITQGTNTSLSQHRASNSLGSGVDIPIMRHRKDSSAHITSSKSREDIILAQRARDSNSVNLARVAAAKPNDNSLKFEEGYIS